MVEVFVHEDGPLLGVQGAEEGVRAVAACGAFGGEGVEGGDEFGALGWEVEGG